MYFKVVTIKFMPRHKLKSHRLSPRPLFSVRWIGKSSFSKRITLFHHHFFLILIFLFFLQQADCRSCDAQACTGKPKPLLGCCFDVNLLQINLKGFCNIFPHLFDMRCHFGLLCNNCRIDIYYTKRGIIIFCCLRLYTVGRYRENACRYRPRQPPPEAHPQWRAAVHLHQNVPISPFHRGFSRRQWYNLCLLLIYAHHNRSRFSCFSPFNICRREKKFSLRFNVPCVFSDALPAASRTVFLSLFFQYNPIFSFCQPHIASDFFHTGLSA